MRPVFIRIGVIVSTAFAVASVAGWAISKRRLCGLQAPLGAGGIAVDIDRGEFAATYVRNDPWCPAPTWMAVAYVPQTPPPDVAMEHRWIGWAYRRQLYGGMLELAVAVPLWSTLTIGVVGMGLFGRMATPTTDRATRCPECGYDLRATPNRCPECGTVPIAERPI